MIVISLDVDGTMEFGDPPGPVTVALAQRLIAAGLVVGCTSDRTRSDQEATWGAHGVDLAFLGGKHQLDAVRDGFDATRYVHVGDTYVDEHYAGLHGFEFIGVVDDPAAAIEAITAIANSLGSGDHTID